MTRPELSPVNTVSEPLWSTIGNLANEIANDVPVTAATVKGPPEARAKEETSDVSMRLIRVCVYGNG